MDQQKFISLLKKINLKKLTIIISTNGTILPNDELKSLLDQCNRVVLSVSLDGIGLVNDWYRWPSKFAKITEVLNQYTSWWGYNSKFLLEIHSVINIYNIWTLDEIVLFINEFYPLWGMDFDWIVTPTWQNISILPFSFKTNLIDKLNFWNEDIKSNVRFNKSNPFTVSIDRLNDNSIGSLEEFKSRSIMLAKERNLDLLEMIPHLKEIF
jgi:sulfatase maturation enzyme AslB (radical SAM superfamily)